MDEHNCSSGCEACSGCDSEELITLIDEQGKEVKFEILDIVVLEDGKQFVVVIEAGKAETEEPEAIILQIKEENGEEIYDTVVDEFLAEKVFNLYLEKVEQEDEE